MLRTLIKRVLFFLVNLSTTGWRTSHDGIVRFQMYRRIKKHQHLMTGKLLHISGQGHVFRRSPQDYSFAEVVETSFPETSATALPFHDDEFDVVIADQVLEHVGDNPNDVFSESFRVLKEGGVIIHTSVLMYHIHGHDNQDGYGIGDYWRFTPTAFRYLARQFSQIIEADGWGNKLALLLIFLDLEHIRIPLSKYHPINWICTTNNNIWPIATWIIARK